jgi:hypothetical protein
MSEEQFPDPPSTDPQNRDRIPPPVQLDYGRARYPQKSAKASAGVQAVAGFGFWVLAVFFAAGFLATTRADPFNSPTGITGLGAELVLVFAFSIWVRVKYKWRGFIPGVLLGFGLTCLVPIGLVFVICGNGKF